MSDIIAIHNRPGSFSDRWIQYCKEHDLNFKIVNCFDSDIIDQLSDVKFLLWHWSHTHPQSLMFARSIIAAAEAMGIKVFPNTATCWHYDDKIAQKYLLESIGAPLVPSYVFYDRHEALEWIERTSFPKVFKLRNGAGSSNVRLVKDAKDARRLCHLAFTKGFTPVRSYFSDVKTKFRKTANVAILLEKIKRMPSVLWNIHQQRSLMPTEKGYIYFQDFLPDNNFDTRITVIGDRAFSYLRGVRPKDFRASGSGRNDYNPKKVNNNCISIAFDISKKIGSQSLAFDFVFDNSRETKFVEISYCYVSSYIYNCPGHWDKELNWHECHMWPEDAILIDVLNEL